MNRFLKVILVETTQNEIKNKLVLAGLTVITVILGDFGKNHPQKHVITNTNFKNFGEI